MPYQGPQGEWYDDYGNLMQDYSQGYGQIGQGAQPTMQQPGYNPASIGPGQSTLPTPNYSGTSAMPGVVDAPLTATDTDGTGRTKRGPDGATDATTADQTHPPPDPS